MKIIVKNLFLYGAVLFCSVDFYKFQNKLETLSKEEQQSSKILVLPEHKKEYTKGEFREFEQHCVYYWEEVTPSSLEKNIFLQK